MDLSHFLLHAGEFDIVELLQLHQHQLVVALVAEQNVNIVLPKQRSFNEFS